MPSIVTSHDVYFGITCCSCGNRRCLAYPLSCMNSCLQLQCITPCPPTDNIKQAASLLVILGSDLQYSNASLKFMRIHEILSATDLT